MHVVDYYTFVLREASSMLYGYYLNMFVIALFRVGTKQHAYVYSESDQM